MRMGLKGGSKNRINEGTLVKQKLSRDILCFVANRFSLFSIHNQMIMLLLLIFFLKFFFFLQKTAFVFKRTGFCFYLEADG